MGAACSSDVKDKKMGEAASQSNDDESAAKSKDDDPVAPLKTQPRTEPSGTENSESQKEMDSTCVSNTKGDEMIQSAAMSCHDDGVVPSTSQPSSPEHSSAVKTPESAKVIGTACTPNTKAIEMSQPATQTKDDQTTQSDDQPVQSKDDNVVPLTSQVTTDLSATDPGKPLGMHISAIRKFLSDHQVVVAENLTTSQINRAVVKPETEGTNKPYIEKYSGLTDGSGTALVAPATVFVSHAWKYSFADTVADSMEQYATKEPNAYFWFDLFTNDQNAVASKDFNWFSDTFKGSIREIGKVLIVLSPWNSPIPICRAWCLFEIAIAFGEKAVEPMICLPQKEVASMSSLVTEDSKCLIKALSDIRAEKAEAKSEDDRDKIFSVIRASEGGFAAVNNQVKARLREWYVGQLTTFVSMSHDARSLIAVGAIMNAFGFYDKALEYYQKCLDAELSARGENHPEVATVYNNMAVVYYDRGDLSKTLEYCQKALSIRFSTLGQQHIDVAGSYNIMALVCDAKGEVNEALEYNEKTLSIRLTTLGENHPDVATSYNNTAAVYATIGQPGKALEYYQKAVYILVNTDGENNPAVARTYNNMATVYKDTGQLDLALNYYHKSVSIFIEMLGENHPNLSSPYNNMALVYHTKGTLDKADHFYRKSLAIALNTLGDNHPNIGFTYQNLAEVYNTAGVKQTALEYCLKSLSVALHNDGEEHIHVLQLYTRVARLCLETGDSTKYNEYEWKRVQLSRKLNVPC